MSTLKSNVLEIGEMAYFEDYPILILFNNSAPDGIREISIIHEFESEPSDEILKVGSKLVMGGTSYTVEELGYVANKNFKELGHLSIYFKMEEGAELLPGAVRVSPHHVPRIIAGDTLMFIK